MASQDKSLESASDKDLQGLADEFGPSEYTVDRTGWPAGPWDEEPDKMQWEKDGLPCYMERDRWGAWRGFVGVRHGNRFYGKRYDECGATVHGGLETSGFHATFPEPAPADSNPGGIWWFGFHCAHGFDFQPKVASLMKLYKRPARAYKTVEFVKAECAKLAGQLK